MLTVRLALASWAAAAAAEPMRVEVGSFVRQNSVAPSFTQSVAHGLGATPTALLVWSIGQPDGVQTGFCNPTSPTAKVSFGVTDGFNSRFFTGADHYCNHHAALTGDGLLAAYDPVPDAGSAQRFNWGDLASWGPTSFSIAWSNSVWAVGDERIGYLVAAGGQAEVREVVLQTTSGVQTVTTPFDPDVLFFLHGGWDDANQNQLYRDLHGGNGFGVAVRGSSQFAFGANDFDQVANNSFVFARQGRAVVAPGSGATGNLPLEATVGFVDGGFTLDLIQRLASPMRLVFLSLAGIRPQLGTVARGPVATLNVSAPGTESVLFLAWGGQVGAGAVLDMRWGFGFANPRGQRAWSISYDHLSVDATQAVRINRTNYLMDPWAAAVTGFSDAGFSMLWSGADAGEQTFYIAFPHLAAAAAVDAGVDAGTDAGFDAGSATDAGTPTPALRQLDLGCGCGGGGTPLALLLALVRTWASGRPARFTPAGRSGEPTSESRSTTRAT